jgi:hypothetical protein
VSDCEGGSGEIWLSMLVRVLGLGMMMEVVEGILARGVDALFLGFLPSNRPPSTLSLRARNARPDLIMPRSKLLQHRYLDISVSKSPPTRSPLLL